MGNLTSTQESVIYGINPQASLAQFSDCIVAGNKNLDDIAVDVQKVVSNAQAEVSEFLASVDGAMASITAAKEAARAAAARKNKN